MKKNNLFYFLAFFIVFLFLLSPNISNACSGLMYNSDYSLIYASAQCQAFTCTGGGTESHCMYTVKDICKCLPLTQSMYDNNMEDYYKISQEDYPRCGPVELATCRCGPNVSPEACRFSTTVSDKWKQIQDSGECSNTSSLLGSLENIMYNPLYDETYDHTFPIYKDGTTPSTNPWDNVKDIKGFFTRQKYYDKKDFDPYTDPTPTNCTNIITDYGKGSGGYPDLDWKRFFSIGDFCRLIPRWPNLALIKDPANQKYLNKECYVNNNAELSNALNFATGNINTGQYNYSSCIVPGGSGSDDSGHVFAKPTWAFDHICYVGAVIYSKTTDNAPKLTIDDFVALAGEDFTKAVPVRELEVRADGFQHARKWLDEEGMFEWENWYDPEYSANCKKNPSDPKCVPDQTGCPSPNDKNLECLIKKKICLSPNYTFTEPVTVAQYSQGPDWIYEINVSGDCQLPEANVNICNSQSSSIPGVVVGCLSSADAPNKPSSTISSSLFIASGNNILKVSHLKFDATYIKKATNTPLIENGARGMFSVVANTFTGFNGPVIQVNGLSKENSGTATIDKNIFENSTYPIRVFYGKAILKNNTFDNITSHAIVINYDGESEIKNNIFNGFTSYIVNVQSGQAVIKNNLLKNISVTPFAASGYSTSSITIDGNTLEGVKTNRPIVDLNFGAHAKIINQDFSGFTVPVADSEGGAVILENNHFSGLAPLVSTKSCSTLGAIRNNTFDKTPSKLIEWPEDAFVDMVSYKVLCNELRNISFEPRDYGQLTLSFKLHPANYDKITDGEVFVGNEHFQNSIKIESEYYNSDPNCDSIYNPPCGSYTLTATIVGDAADAVEKARMEAPATPIMILFNSGDKFSGTSTLTADDIALVNMELFDQLKNEYRQQCIDNEICCSKDKTCQSKCAKANACIAFANDPDGLKSKEFDNGRFWEKTCKTKDQCDYQMITKYPSSWSGEASDRLTCDEYKGFDLATHPKGWRSGFSEAYFVSKCMIYDNANINRFTQYFRPDVPVVDPRTIMQQDPGTIKIIPKAGPDPLILKGNIDTKINPGVMDQMKQQIPVDKMNDPLRLNDINPSDSGSECIGPSCH